MKQLIFTGLFLALIVPCHARWGFTHEECLKQYGKTLKEQRDQTSNVLQSATFNLHGIIIRTFYDNKRVNMITYRRADDQEMSAETLLKILSAYTDKARNLYFQPPEALERFGSLGEKMPKEKILSASVKEQVWIRHSEKSAATLIASYNRTAKMLAIKTLMKKGEAGGPSLGF